MKKDSEKHHESEKSKKRSAQELSLNASEVSIDQWVQTEQNLKNDDLKEVSIEKRKRIFSESTQKI